MIVKDGNGNNSMMISFSELAVNKGYIQSLKNIFETRNDEIQKEILDGKNEKPIRVYVKTSDIGITELKVKDKEYLNLEVLTKFLDDVQQKLIAELEKDNKQKLKDKIEELEKLEE